MIVEWHALAEADFEAIATWLASRRPRAALAFAEAIDATIELAREFPQVGRVAVGFRGDETLRELIVSNYRVIYRVQSGRLLILRVWDARRDGTPEIAGERVEAYERVAQ